MPNVRLVGSAESNICSDACLGFFLGFDEEQNIGASRAEMLPTAAVCLVCALSITIACIVFAGQLKHSFGVTTGAQQ